MISYRTEHLSLEDIGPSQQDFLDYWFQLYEKNDSSFPKAADFSLSTLRNLTHYVRIARVDADGQFSFRVLSEYLLQNALRAPAQKDISRLSDNVLDYMTFANKQSVNDGMIILMRCQLIYPDGKVNNLKSLVAPLSDGQDKQEQHTIGVVELEDLGFVEFAQDVIFFDPSITPIIKSISIEDYSALGVNDSYASKIRL